MTDCADVPTVDHWNVARLNLFYSYYLGIFSSQLSWFHFYIFFGRSTYYSNKLWDFSVTIPRCCKDVCVKCFFLAQLDSGILLLQNASLGPMILVALILELIDTLISGVSFPVVPNSLKKILHFFRNLKTSLITFGPVRCEIPVKNSVDTEF